MSGDRDGWARIPWSIIDAAVGPYALAVYCAIARHADKDGKAWPSMQRIADVAGVSKGNAKASVAALVTSGFVARTDRRKADGSADSPLYRLTDAVGGGSYGDPRRSPGDPGVGHTVTGGGSPGDPEQEPLNKNHRKKEEKDACASPSLPEKSTKAKRTRREPFTPPTVEEVATYCRERRNAVNPSAFVNHYASVGWKVGKNPMVDWRAAVRKWEQSDNGTAKPATPSPVSKLLKPPERTRATA